MAGMDRETGRLLDGWEHVVQSLFEMFTTGYGLRIMREWFGTVVPQLLGENLVPSTVVQFYSSICTAIELWEPRFRVLKVTPLSNGPEALRQGQLGLRIDGEYRPRALKGDLTPEGMRTVHVGWRNGSFYVRRSS
ncbi:GPW/gp25 family protein [Rhodopseudomonas palustris]|nr:GPW/gp25 family protein [Rhodopseudomonas palustris]